MKNKEKLRNLGAVHTSNLLKEKRGITLIALVVTIIVLLILAAVSISAVVGENGIITKASDSKEKTVIGKEKEQIEIAYSAATINTLNGEVTEDMLRDELDKLLGDVSKSDDDKQTIVSTNTSDGTFNVLYKETNHNYNVGNESIKYLDHRLLSRQVIPANYGDTINYSVTVNNVVLDDWKILYNDGKNVFIIASESIPANVLDLQTSLTGLESNTKRSKMDISTRSF